MLGRPGHGLDAITIWLCEMVEAQRHESRLLLSRAASDLLGVPQPDIVVGAEPSGRPRLGGAAADLNVSISHSRGFAAVALTATGEVGVDLEIARPLPALSLARRWMTDHETRWLEQRPASQHVE